ncbi:hypothetical protein ABAC460_09540 [Asticcacaulis sp. AC460]|uniref:hypothetical protein n=1 Tax=Asticcacaulis sp. AC460 TaxID=1282360 RepID=UPI0003C402B5|nr:hypothetical protein [Asticcacaulis sp. AC460]ESQ90000.1 hypothetical protein ABAC460_09540 [Asticcacaulis sp. AC460]
MPRSNVTGNTLTLDMRLTSLLRDKKSPEAERFVCLKAELQIAFAAPETTYELLDVEEVIARNPRGRKPS